MGMLLRRKPRPAPAPPAPVIAAPGNVGDTAALALEYERKVARLRQESEERLQEKFEELERAFEEELRRQIAELQAKHEQELAAARASAASVTPRGSAPPGQTGNRTGGR